MSKSLQKLLGNTHPLFSFSLHALEGSVGREGVDVRLISDIIERAHNVMRNFGLDVADSTARELYQMLNSKVKQRDFEQLFFGTDFTLINISDEIVSFNLIDIIENSHHELPFEQRLVSHGQRALRGEIIERYNDHRLTSEQSTLQHALSGGIFNEEDGAYGKQNSEKNMHTDDGSAAARPRLLAIGDIFTDAFIKLDENYARIDTDDDGSKRLSFPFGSKPPYERVDIVKAVGPSPNAAISCSRLGLDVGLMSWLGDDDAGRESLEHLASEHVDTAQMVTQPNTKSSYWYVLRHGADRTMLVRSEEYSYDWNAPEHVPDWIYLSYIGANSWPLHVDLLAYLNEHPEIKLVFQPGTYHFEWGVEKLKDVYRQSYMIVLNREEAVDVTGRQYDSMKDLFEGLHELGPKVAVITDGPNGSYASHDGKMYSIPNYPDPAPPVDRTGAGDAFASTIVAALAVGEPIETALTWAPINSMNVVQKIGAQLGLLSRDEIKKYLESAPDWYQVKELES